MSRSIRRRRGLSNARRIGRIRACAHLAGRYDALVEIRPRLERAPRLAGLIGGEPDEAAFAALRRSELIDRRLGSATPPEALGRQLDRIATPGERRRPNQTEKLIEIRANVVRCGSYPAIELAEVVIPRNLFGGFLRLTAALRPALTRSTV